MITSVTVRFSLCFSFLRYQSLVTESGSGPDYPCELQNQRHFVPVNGQIMSTTVPDGIIFDKMTRNATTSWHQTSRTNQILPLRHRCRFCGGRSTAAQRQVLMLRIQRRAVTCTPHLLQQ